MYNIDKQRESGVRLASASPRPIATIELHGRPSVAFRSSAKRKGLEPAVTAALSWTFPFPCSYCGFREKTWAFRPRCEAKLLLDWCVGSIGREGSESGFEKGSRAGGFHARADHIPPILLFWCP